jgi:hypothetical protein
VVEGYFLNETIRSIRNMMEIREVYRSGDMFHLNVTAFPPHLKR